MYSKYDLLSGNVDAPKHAFYYIILTQCRQKVDKIITHMQHIQ